YGNQGAVAKALPKMKRAYDLRERVTERERMYIESQYVLQQFDLPKALESYKLYVTTYPRDAQALNNLAQTYAYVGDFEQALAGFQKTWEIAKWDNVAANNVAWILLAIDRIPEAERYLKEALEQGGGDDTNYHGNILLHDFQAGHADWEKEAQWATTRPAGFMVNDVYMPQVRAAIAMMEHRPERVSGLLASAGSYMPVSKAPQLLGRASLDMGQWQQAVTDLQPGVRYRGLALQEGPVGTAQAP